MSLGGGTNTAANDAVSAAIAKVIIFNYCEAYKFEYINEISREKLQYISKIGS